MIIKTHFKNTALAVLRIGASVMLMTHGIPKVSRLFDDEIKFGDPIGIGVLPSLILIVFAEVVATAFIIVGFRTRFFAIFPTIAMLVAAFIAHMDDPFARKEKALLFALCFIVIFLVGPGKYSIDKN